MKRLLLLLIYLMPIFLIVGTANAQDSLMVKFSLFYESQKNKDYKGAVPYGWMVINSDPTNFIRFKLFPRMEETLWYLHDSTNASPQQVKALDDTIEYFYDKAIQYEPDNAGYYYARKAFVEETWLQSDPDTIIHNYERAIEKKPDLDEYYQDRLGLLYIKNANDDNGYKLKALELYQKLADKSPDNPLWIQRQEGIAENIDELVDITYKAWQMDKDNVDKAFKYGTLCMQAKDYEKAKEPFEFLVGKSPEVINYWRQLANIYDKLDDNDNAIKAYKKLIDLQPDGKDYYLNLALVYKRMDQLSVSRTYLQRAAKADPNWDYPYLIEAQLYEQGARNCDFDFMAKCVYLLAVNTYRKAASLNGQFQSAAVDRIKALSNSVPTKEDYFFRKMKSGDTIKIEGACFGWIDRSVQVP